MNYNQMLTFELVPLKVTRASSHRAVSQISSQQASRQ